jgi:basic amino acid/polyamine antiporter, APA family
MSSDASASASTTPGDDGGGRTLGLPQATSLVVGTIIGVGIFNVPASLASYGPISLVAMALTTVGALCLAMLFASLSRRMPADGGPYAYSRAAFGNLVGFSNAWLYWIPAWAGNAAIATGWVLYVERFVNTGHGTAGTIALTLAGIWAAAVINLIGIRSMGRIQLWTSVLKFLPLLAMSSIGLFFVDLDNFTPFNLSGQSALPAIGSAMALCLFSYIGVESASVAAAKVSDPTRNVPRATIAVVSFVVSVLFIVYSANTDAEGFAVYEPFVYALGAFLLGVPVYLLNRTRMTPPPGPPPPVDALGAAATVVTAPTAG